MPIAWLVALTLTACSSIERDVPRPSQAPPSDAPATALARTEDPLEQAIAEHWRAAGVVPVERARDEERLRRITLDLVGRIPTPAETEAFLASEAPDRDAALVDRLLASDEWAAYWAEVLTHTLAAKADAQRPRLRDDLQAYLESQLREHARWDRITVALLTAEGTVQGEGSFLALHGRANRVEGVTAETARVFMGLQLQCAQCHDDPEGRFTQQEFYELAAYYGRTRIRLQRVDGQRVPRIVDTPRGEMRMPTEYDAPGDRSGAKVFPSFVAFDGPATDDQSRRQALASGIVGSPSFADAAVNHAWARLLGRGIVDPWDDLGDPRHPRRPALLEVLARDFEASGYDLRALLRRITLSSAYQRSSQGRPEGSDERERAFAQAPVRAMDATQLMSSLLVATGLHDVGARDFRREVELRRQQIRREVELTFDDDEMATAGRFDGNVPQALLLLNGELTNQGVGARSGALAEILERHAEPGARIDALYLRVYGHRPDATRHAALLRFLAERRDEPTAYEDLMHAMLLSSEFLTIH